MEFWQFKVNHTSWAENYNDEYEKLKVGFAYPQIISHNAKHKPVNNIGDIVFIYNTKKHAIKKYPQGIYLICKIIKNMDEDNFVKLEVIKDIRENPIEPEYLGFEVLMKKIHKLNQNGTYYKFEEKNEAQQIFDYIMSIEDEFLIEEIPKTEQDKIFEGAKTTVTVNAYERKPIARKKCIEYYGTTCFICGFNFEKVYGEIGKNFIHVHHIKPLSEIQRTYEINPVKDLRPVCPNCHAMLHKKRPAYSINEIKQIIKK